MEDTPSPSPSTAVSIDGSETPSLPPSPLVAAEINPATGLPYSRRYHKLLDKRKKLPVWGIREKFIDTLAKRQVVVVAADPGSGKSTQIPQFVIDAGYGSFEKQIACTQPRRLVATFLSRRVAQEMDVKVGEKVGHTVLFEECSSPKTILKYLTDGMLLREALSDRLLEKYKVIIIDEAQLRTLATDFLLAFLKKLVSENARPDLKLVIMSTQSDAKKFRDYFDGARIVQATCTPHPVQITYADQPVWDYVSAAVERIEQILLSEPAGDIIVFLTGGEEIEACCRTLTKLIADMGEKIGPINLCPLHSNLTLEMQKMVFKGKLPPRRKGGPAGRKIVVSTDIAESSLPIDGIVYVIDSGFTKRKVYNPCKRVESLLVVPISKASAYRRSGCAKRSLNGKCFRLYTEKFLEDVQTQETPEVLRANLAGTVLQLKKLGIDDLIHLDLMDFPAAETLVLAYETLTCLGALDREGKLTKLGEQMSEFPLNPQMSKMIVASTDLHCSNEILSIAAMLLVPNCFLRPLDDEFAADEVKAKFIHVNGDHLTLLNIYHAYKENNGDSTWCEQNLINQTVLKSAVSVRSQLMTIMRKLKLELCSTDIKSCDYYNNISKGILAGYFMQVAQLQQSGHYITLRNNHVVDLHPSSCLASKPAWVVYNDFVLASRNFIRIITDVRCDWLFEIAAGYYHITSIS